MLISHLATRECLATGKGRNKGRWWKTKYDQPLKMGEESKNDNVTNCGLRKGCCPRSSGQDDISLLCVRFLFSYLALGN